MNIVKMFRGIAMAQRLLESGGAGGLSPPAGADGGARCASARGGAASRRPLGYDLVLRLRPDLCFCGALDLTPMLTRPTHHLWLPWWSTHVGWAFDQIAVGAPATMAAYARAYSSTVKRLVAQQQELYPEAVMWAHLQTLGPAARQLRPLRDFRAGLARKQPSFHVEDPFTKIKQDLGVITPPPSAQEPLPGYECAAARASATQ